MPLSSRLFSAPSFASSFAASSASSSAFVSRRQCLALGALALAPAWVQAAAPQSVQPGDRVVSLSASVTGDLLALGLPVVGTATRLPGASLHPRTKMPVMWRAALAKLPAPPQPLAPDADAAALTELSPSLIVVDAAMGADAARLEALRAVAPVWVVEGRFDRWQDRLNHLAATLGREAEAREWLAQYDAAVKDFRETAAFPPNARWDLLQMHGSDPAGDPFALSPQSPLGRLLTEAGFALDDTAAKLPGAAAPDALGRVPVPLAQLGKVITAPWALLVNHGEQIASQVCCTPAWQEIPTITTYQRHELDEYALSPDAQSALRLLSTLKELMATRAAS